MTSFTGLGKGIIAPDPKPKARCKASKILSIKIFFSSIAVLYDLIQYLIEIATDIGEIRHKRETKTFYLIFHISL
jgi:hypothetical protein